MIHTVAIMVGLQGRADICGTMPETAGKENLCHNSAIFARQFVVVLCFNGRCHCFSSSQREPYTSRASTVAEGGIAVTVQQHCK